MKLRRGSAVAASFTILTVALALVSAPPAIAAANQKGATFSSLDTLLIEAQSNYTHGRYKEALELFEQANGQETTSDYQHTELQLGLAECYRALGQYKKAEDLFKKAIDEVQEEDAKHLNKKYKAGAKHSSDILPLLMNDLSLLYIAESRFPEAEAVLNKCIELGITKVGPKNVNLALPMNALTRLYLKWGKFDLARTENEKTLALFSTPASKSNWLYPYTTFNLAEIINHRGEYQKAEKLYKATLLGIQDLFGFDHQYCAVVLEPLGDMYRQEGRFADATKAFQRVRKIREMAFTREHPDYGKALLNLALVNRDEGKYGAAEEFCKQASSVIEEALGNNNVQTAECWIASASIYRYQGRYADAEQLARKALALDQKLLEPDHPTVAHDMVELANILADEGKEAEAQELLNNALQICKKKLGPDHPDIASITESLARLLTMQKEYGKASAMYKTAQELAEKSLGKGSSQAVQISTELADSLIADKKYADAEPLLQRIVEQDEKLYGKKSPQLARDLQSLADVYSNDSKKNLAAPLLAQAAEITASLPGSVAVSKLSSVALKENAARDRTVKDKWAIVIGISNFKDPSINLKYAAKDATDFRNFLLSQENFRADHVQLLTDANATRDNIISKLGDGWLGHRAGKDDLVVVYVSSHGSAAQEDVGVNFLVAHDTDKTKLVSTGLPMQWLTKIIQEQVHSNRVVLILDVCHSGSATDESKKVSDSADSDSTSADANDKGGKGLGRSSGVDLSKLSLGSGQIVLCSSLSDQVSWESKHYPNSVFTRRLIQALQCNGKDTSLSEAYANLKDAVGAEVLGDRGAVQTPNLSNKNWSGGDPVLSTPATGQKAVQ